MEQVYKLVNEDRWSMDDALHEIACVRMDAHTWMMPRARPPPTPKGAGKPAGGNMGKGKGYPPPPPPSYRPDRPPRGDKGKGKDRRDSGGKGKDRSRSGRPPAMDGWSNTWATHITMNGQSRPICMRYNVAQCRTADCRFEHVCPVPNSSRAPCGQRHRAVDCSMNAAAPRL